MIELRSRSDQLADLQAKMAEWTAAGCRLGWLIDPATETVCVYRPGREVETLQGFERELAGETVLPEFKLDLRELR